ncbi:MAG: GAF domain-containing protein [Candidatus Aminicenantes bacterium]|nr:GAF domain-containing protein [Candidatus Aminicenantes bacterium]
MANKDILKNRYKRIYNQLQDLLPQTNNRIARLATVAAILHFKMPQFSWTGFYILVNGKLIVGPYQGPLACQVLDKKKGVCWAGIEQKKTIIVPDVHKYPDHIACDSRTNSEIVVSLFDKDNQVWGVLDIDSRQFETFSDIDKEWLEKIVALIEQ